VIGSVSGIYTYPVKSCRGISHERRAIGARGFLYDREWMIIDRVGVAQTQRELPHMALIRTELRNERLTLTAPEMPPLLLSLAFTGPVRRVKIWDETSDAHDLGEEPAAWLTRFLGAPLRLVRMTEDNHRPLDPTYAIKPTDETGFADGYPLLLISEASLADLNTRLPNPIPMNRFRTNIIIRDVDAYAEDTWQRISIGDTIFEVVKPCARCPIPTTNQETAERGPEPMRTLLRYRPKNAKGFPYFGQNLIARTAGGIMQLGDPLDVIEYKPDVAVRG